MSLQAADFLAGRVVSVLKGLGLNDLQVKEAQVYLDGTVSERDFFKRLTTMDMEQLNYRVKETMGKTYQGLREKDVNYAGRYLNLLFALGQKSVLECLYQYMGYSPNKVIEEMKSLNAPLPYAVAWVAENAVKYSVSLSSIRSLERFYTDNEGDLVEGWKLCGINARIVIAAFLVAKGPRAYQEYRKWLDDVFLNSIKALFHDPDRFSDVSESMAKYVKGGLFVRESMLEEIKKRTAQAMINPYIVHLLAYTSYAVRDASQVGSRMLKLLLTIEHREVFSFLAGEGHQGARSINEERFQGLREVVLDFGIPREQFIAWLGEHAVGRQGQQTYFSQDSGIGRQMQACLEREFAADPQVFQRAIALAEGRAAIFLSKFLWEKGIGRDYLPDAEEAFLDLVGKVLEECNVHQTLIKDSLACLRGEKDFATIQAGLKKVGQDYRLQRLKDCVWFEGISPLYFRTLSLLGYAGGYGILGKTIYKEFAKDNNKEFTDFVAMLKGAGLDQGAVLGFILHWATTDTWDSEGKKLNQAARQTVAQMLEADPAEVINNISACSAEGRAYLVEKLFEESKEKYAPLLIEYMDDSAKAVRDKVIG
ncbi:MAG TPA: hypothetical protein VNT57_06990, partial [Desulfobacteria bacterium]|nr:hypothetical protein [Desulfobacteria bacterium]